MAESKRGLSRLSTIRESVKKITERFSDGESGSVKKHDEQGLELEKLRIQIQSMEEEVRQLHHSRYQLELANRQNDKLAATLQEAKAQIEALRAEVDKLTAPPSTYAIFSSLNDDKTANVYVAGRKMKVNLHPSIKAKELRK